jgi:excisionase family DNA binding protein
VVTEQRQRLLSMAEASALLKVHPNTLRKWVDEGRVPSVRRPGGGGQRRFEAEAIEELRQQLGLRDNGEVSQ